MLKRLAIAVALSSFCVGFAFATDFDGDGVDDAVDCRPLDGTTWAVPTEANGLILAGAASTSFHWTAPASPGGTATLYDLIRATSPSGFAAASCLDSNDATTSPALTDSAVPAPGTAFFYLVRSKTACGGDLGTTSSNIARTGVSCSTAVGGSCSIDASCDQGWCCGGTCADATADANNCGGCGLVCVASGGTNACVAGACSPTCNPGFGDCDGNPNNGCQALVDVVNCGACGFVCPGYGQTADNVTCDGTENCTFSCQGENYDVDTTMSNGCELVDAPTSNHVQNNAVSQGSKTCNDTDTFSFGGTMLNDTRVHVSPAVTGFDTTSGSAPDWMSLSATGGTFCVNDLSITLQMTGANQPACYRLTVITNKGTFSCQASTSGACVITQASGAYSDGTTVLFEVQRTCLAQTGQQSVPYTISGHL